MFIIHGRRTARIKRYTDNQQACRNCGSFDLDVRVYRGYYHAYFLPIIPLGPKSSKIRCKSCRSEIFADSLSRHYEGIAKTPFYLWTVPLLFAALIVLISFTSSSYQRKKADLVAGPLPGDVYTIETSSGARSSFHFLRLAALHGDTLVMYHNDRTYHKRPMKLDDGDYFLKDDELQYTKAQLQDMLRNGEIAAVDREYGDYEGFNQVFRADQR